LRHVWFRATLERCFASPNMLHGGGCNRDINSSPIRH
jgi:hypothetical protein